MAGKRDLVTYTETFEVYRYTDQESPTIRCFATQRDLDAYLSTHPGTDVRMQEVFTVSTPRDDSGALCTRSRTRVCQHRTGLPPSWVTAA
jgi:hypothetical protein